MQGHSRFLFFFPPPAGALAGGGSCGVGAFGGAFGVASCEAGGGVAEERIPCNATGVSGGMLSVLRGTAFDEKTVFKCAEVARIAFSKSMLFCCFFGAPNGVVTLFFGGSDVPRSPIAENSSSRLRFLFVSSDIVGSMIGHTNPVRGV